MLAFFIIKTLVVFEVLAYTEGIGIYEYLSVLLFMPPFFLVMYEIYKSAQQQQISRRSLERMLNSSSLVSKADAKGRITYVNDKFCEVSGYRQQELLGKDHSVLNSGRHPKKFWTEMYLTTVKYRSVWHDTVTNRSKDGEEYYVKSWVIADFDEKGKHVGYTSVRQDVTELFKSISKIEMKTAEVTKKNTYLEHAAKILRHDMHSGINTYIPRGLSSLKRRLSDEIIAELKVHAPLRMLEEGLRHSQKVYNGVKEFTNLVKKDAKLEKSTYDLGSILKDYLGSTAYSNQVHIGELVEAEVNEPLFCTAVDNLIRNGLKYNDSPTKYVKIYMQDGDFVIEDNGRGLTQEEFTYLSQPYTRKEGQKEGGTGLGLNICIAILEEHGFGITCQKLQKGTKLTIKINQQQ
jgi:PAS domain S-box-containing protein